MALAAEIDVGRLHVPMDQTCSPQLRQRVAKIHGQIDGAGLGHGGVGQVTVQGCPEFRQKIDVIADAVLLGLDLVAVKAVQIGTARKGLQLFQLCLVVGDHLLVIGLRSLFIGSGACENQSVHLLLGFRNGNMLERIELVGLGAFDGIDCDAASAAQAVLYLHIGHKCRIEFDFCQMIRLLQLIQLLF